jgi:hypothetical protein
MSYLSKSIALALAGGALSMGGMSTASAASTTMYNLYNNFGTTTCSPCTGPGNGVGGFTDGWVWGNPTTPTYKGGTSGGNSNAATPGWVGTTGIAPSTTTPFGYTAGHSLNWAVHIENNTDSAQISNADALSKYNVSADIDTAKGAWLDNAASPVGWLHDLDIGLFKSDVATDVKLSIQGVNFSGTNFGFTVFKGMSSVQTGYVHHGSWNANQNGTSTPPGLGFTAGDIVASTDTSGLTPLNLNEIIFSAQSGQVYTIVLGGWRDGTWYDTNDGYVLNVQAVPLPATAWMFGSGLLGMLGFMRKKKTVV